MEVRTIKLEWEELDSLFENIFKEVLGKTIQCHVDFDDQTYWGVRFKDYEMPVEEIESVCYAVNEYSAPVEHLGRLRLNTLVAFG